MLFQQRGYGSEAYRTQAAPQQGVGIVSDLGRRLGILGYLEFEVTPKS